MNLEAINIRAFPREKKTVSLQSKEVSVRPVSNVVLLPGLLKSNLIR